MIQQICVRLNILGAQYRLNASAENRCNCEFSHTTPCDCEINCDNITSIEALLIGLSMNIACRPFVCRVFFNS